MITEFIKGYTIRKCIENHYRREVFSAKQRNYSRYKFFVADSITP